MIVTQITVGAFQENCYLVEDPKTNAIAIVDPGSEPERIVDAIDKSGGRVEAIWITHAHVDHIGAIAPLKKRYNVPVWLHPLDEPLYRVGGRQAQLYGIPYEEPPAPELLVETEQESAEDSAARLVALVEERLSQSTPVSTPA